MASRSVYMAGAAKRASPLDRRVLDRKVPRSRKYDSVGGRVDSGTTVEKVRVLTARQYNQRRNEVFCRVTPGQLQELLAEYEGDAREDLLALAATPMHGGGPRVASHGNEAEPAYERPYLILDVRSAADYARGHILQARSFPATMLKQDRMTPEIQRFRNREASLIIVYDNEERAAVEAAHRFLQRGFENVFVLTGGLARFLSDGHGAFLEGDAPQELSLSLRSSPGSSGGGAAALGRTPPSRSGRPMRGPQSGSRRHSGSDAVEATPETDRLSHGSRSTPRPRRVMGGPAPSVLGLQGPEHRLTPRKLGRHNATMQAHSGPGTPGSVGVHRLRRMVQENQAPQSYAPSVGDAQSQMSHLSVAESVISRSTARRGRHI